MMELALDNEDPLGRQKVPKAANCSSGRSSPLSSTATPSRRIERDDHVAAGAGGSVEVEMLGHDDFEFLDGATELGSLRSGR